jgi:hypothetical protein
MAIEPISRRAGLRRAGRLQLLWILDGRGVGRAET